jgi:hypothetical protein
MNESIEFFGDLVGFVNKVSDQVIEGMNGSPQGGVACFAIVHWKFGTGGYETYICLQYISDSTAQVICFRDRPASKQVKASKRPSLVPDFRMFPEC